MDFNWNDIYKDFLNCKNRSCSERDLQICIHSVFRYYLRWQNNIIAEESIPIGATNTMRPDFVLYKDELPQVVIEAKEPNHKQTERNQEQLFSYMRQKKVDFGLYIGEMIQLYYDVPTDAEQPLLIFTLDYNNDNKFGHSFVSLFNYIDFNKELLVDFCTKRIREIQLDNKLKLDRQKLLSNEGCKLCESLLRTHFLSKGYTEDNVNTILDNIEIVLRNKEQPTQLESIHTTLKFAPTTDQKQPSKPRKKYSINGVGSYCKNGIAFELVKLYIKDHPSSYHTIESFFNRQIPNYVLSKKEVELKEINSSDKTKDQRWRKNSPLESNDGIVFYVTTQVGEDCPIDFNDIVSLSEKLGYKIEQIS